MSTLSSDFCAEDNISHFHHIIILIARLPTCFLTLSPTQPLNHSAQENNYLLNLISNLFTNNIVLAYERYPSETENETRRKTCWKHCDSLSSSFTFKIQSQIQKLHSTLPLTQLFSWSSYFISYTNSVIDMKSYHHRLHASHDALFHTTKYRMIRPAIKMWGK